jgi:hypothetical protein
LWHGLPTVPLAPTEGLPFRSPFPPASRRSKNIFRPNLLAGNAFRQRRKFSSAAANFVVDFRLKLYMIVQYSEQLNRKRSLV